MFCGKSSPLRADDMAPHETTWPQALTNPISIDRSEQPLSEVIAELQKQTGVRMRFRGLPIGVNGTGARVLVTPQFQSVALDKALSTLLPKYGLDWTTSRRTVVISTTEQIWSQLDVRVYPVGNLLANGENGRDLEMRSLAVAERIKRAITPQDWTDVGGRASIVTSGTTLIVKHTTRSQNKIAQLLKEIQKNQQESWPIFGQMAQTQGAEVSRMERLLSRPIQLERRQKPFRHVVEELNRRVPISISIDLKSLEDEGISVDDPVDLRCDGVSLRAALNQLLNQWQLGYVNQPDGILISTMDYVEQHLETQSYPVSELARVPGEPRNDFNPLMELATTIVGPESWEDVGGPATIQALPSGSLVIAQTAENHVRLRDLFDSLLELRRRQQDDRAAQEPIVLAQDARNEMLNAVLNRRVGRLRSDEMPLSRFADMVREETGLLLMIDTRALDDVGIPGDTPVTLDVRNISLRSALHTVLREFGLTLLIDNELVWISTPKEAEARLNATLLPVRDLVTLDGHLPAKFVPIVSDQLVALVTTTIEPYSWDEVGGPGAIELFANQSALVVSQTDEVQAKVRWLIQGVRALRKAVRTEPEQFASAQIPFFGDPGELENEQRIRAALASDATLKIHRKPLDVLAKELSAKHGIEIVIDTRALEDIGLDKDVSITFESSGIPLGAALQHMTHPLDLTFIVRDECVQITTPEEIEAQLVTRFYPVQDLVLPVEDPQSQVNTERDPEVDRLLKADFDTLIDLITVVLSPDSWDDVGGPGTVEDLALASTIVVSHSEQVQSRVKHLIGALRDDLRASQSAAANTGPRLVGTKREATLWRVLNGPVGGIASGQLTVRELATALNGKLKSPVIVDKRAMENSGIPFTAKVNYVGFSKTMAESLDQSLKPLEMTWTIRDDAIVLTTLDESESAPLVFVYPVRHCLPEANADIDALFDHITDTHSPQSWDSVGGMGAIEYWYQSRAFVIAQTPQIHRQIAADLMKK